MVLLARHQLGALVATAVDFATMIATVELGLCGPVAATAVGALTGATVNFWLSRTWIFAATGGGTFAQALRYAAVSLASLGWNTVGEYVAVHWLGLQYVMGRVIVAVLVSVGWNYPMHRNFVFRR